MLDKFVDTLPFFKKIIRLKSDIFWFVYCLFYDFWNFSFSSLDRKRYNFKKSQYINNNYFNKYKYKSNFLNSYLNIKYNTYDVFSLKSMSNIYKIKKFKLSPYRSFFRIIDTNNGFYFNFLVLFNRKNFFFFLKLLY